jgi:TRAP transporter TAXI family solute receptor
MAKRFRLFTLLAGVAVVCSTMATSGAVQFISIATGGTGGAYFPIGAAMADIFNKKLTGYNASAQTTAASKVNCIQVQEGKSDLALVLGDTLAFAYKGDSLGGFTKPLTKLRVVADLYPNIIQIVARKDSGISSLADLRGKKVSVGAPGSGTEINARQILEAAGMSYKDFGRTDYLSFVESVDQLKNRAIDATLVSSGLPNPSVLDLAFSQGIAVVPIEETVVKTLTATHPFFSPTAIPKGTYKNQDAPVKSVAIPNFLITRDDLDEKVVYELTRAIFENLDRLVLAHVAAKEIQLATATVGLPIPLHPGAERFYREKKVLR